jgi:hypothetical protein
MSDGWIDPTDGSKPDLDLGDGHTLKWTEYEGHRVGGIIRHSAPTETGYCEGAFWLRGNAFCAEHKPDSPQWDLSGGFDIPTLSPSFLCHCGDHGWITNGRWVRA